MLLSFSPKHAAPYPCFLAVRVEAKETDSKGPVLTWVHTGQSAGSVRSRQVGGDAHIRFGEIQVRWSAQALAFVRLNGNPKDVLIPGTWDYTTLGSQKDFADVS